MISAFSLHSHKTKGFTLIEISIVMAIVALLLTVVGPFAISALDKSEARVELQIIKQKLVNAPIRAFYSGEDLLYIFSGNTLKISNSTKEREYYFDYISFPYQTIIISSKGFTTTEFLVINSKNGKLQLSLNEIINGQYSISDL